MTNQEVKNSSRRKVIEYFINHYFYNDTDEELSSGIDKILVVLDEWFAKNNRSWQIDKVNEEYGEIKDAVKSWRDKKDEFTRFHVIVEVSDYIAAFSSYVKRYINSVDLKDIRSDNPDFIEMMEDVKTIIEMVDIKPWEVVTNIENKFTEIFMGIVTYKKLKAGDTKDILCKVIRTLYTTREINDVNNEKKIVKEIRRMWYARNFNKMFDA